MTYEVTANRKRPQTFDELVGQDFIVATLKSSIVQGRVAHAYLFSGPRGVGKTSAARILAKALNCEQGPTDTPCGQCASCREIAQGNSLDVIEIDGASNTSVNDVRQIKDEVLFAPNSSRYKIYIIDEVHMLSNSAFNALLKTIEEPPPYIVFVFATTEVHKVPATIRSRCQQFSFRLLSVEQISEMLRRVVTEAGVPAEEAALSWVAKEATGSLRDAYTLLDQVISFSRGEEGSQAGAGSLGSEGGAPEPGGITLERIREKLGLVGVEQVSRMGSIIAQRDKKRTLELTQEILAGGVSVEQFVIDLTDFFRSLLFLKCGIRRDSLLAFSARDVAPEVLEAFSVGQLEKALEMLLELYRNLRHSLQPRFDLELVVCQLADLHELILPSELLGSLRALRAQLEGAPGAVLEAPAAPGGGGTLADGRQAEGVPPAASAAQSAAAGATPPAESAAKGPATPPAARGPTPGTPPPGQPAPGKTSGEPEAGFERLLEAVRKERLALAASLSKADSWELTREELRLRFKESDRYSGEQVQRERDVILRHAQVLFRPEGTLRLRVQYSGSGGRSGEGDKSPRDQAEMIKKIFRGEIVQGE